MLKIVPILWQVPQKNSIMAADAAQPEGPPLTELESLQLKANQITDDSLDSTRRMISLCEDVSGNMH